MAFGAQKGSALVGNAASIGTSLAAAGSQAVVIGDLIFVNLFEQTTSTSTTCADNLGNSYTALSAATDAGTTTCRVYYSRVTVAGTLTTVTVTTNGGTNNGCIAAVVIEGPFEISPLDKNPSTITSDNASPFTCPSTGTLSQSNECVVAYSASTGSATWSATAPNTLAGQTATAAIGSVRIGIQAVNVTSAVSPEFTGTNPTDSVLGVATFEMMLSAATIDTPDYQPTGFYAAKMIAY